MGGNGVSDSDGDDGGGDIIVYMINSVIFKIVYIYKYTVAAYSCLHAWHLLCHLWEYKATGSNEYEWGDE